MLAGGRTLLRLSAPERGLLLAVALLLAVIPLALRALPVRTVRRLLARIVPSRAAAEAADPTYLDRVAWAVRAVAARLGTSCLPQALVAERLLARRGYAVTLGIGVARPSAGVWQGHAWVEHDGRIVVGGDLAGYTRVAALEGCPS